MRHLNSEHISFVAALIVSRGGNAEAAVHTAIKLQQLAHTECDRLNAEAERAESRQRAREDVHDEGNATNHKRMNCSIDSCGLDPVI